MLLWMMFLQILVKLLMTFLLSKRGRNFWLIVVRYLKANLVTKKLNMFCLLLEVFMGYQVCDAIFKTKVKIKKHVKSEHDKYLDKYDNCDTKCYM